MRLARPSFSSLGAPALGALVLGAALVAGRLAHAEDAPPPPAPEAPADPPAPTPETPGKPESTATPAKPDVAPAAKPEAAAPSSAAPKSERTDWRTGDTIDVRVLGRADLSCTVPVLEDGTIDVPFAGRFRLAGATLDSLRPDVEVAFARLERTPQVSLVVRALAASQFYVVGEVGKAGVYTFARSRSVSALQAIGMAGGFGPEGDFTRVQLVPAAGGNVRTLDASPSRAAALATVLVGDGDTIVVPSVGRVYLVGQVNRTGGFAPPPGEVLTLSRAIALGGGFTRLADAKSVLVSGRDPSGASTAVRYNVAAILEGRTEDPIVAPGQLIFVSERVF